ncbi:hypothetical protein H8356DRAFT_1342607, partial [Neocallimastix lanati (nom. inval.)]
RTELAYYKRITDIINRRESPEYVKEYYKEVLLNTKFQLIHVPFTPNNMNNTNYNRNRNNLAEASSSSSSSSNNNNNEVNGPYRAYDHNSFNENRYSTYDSDTASSENEDDMEATGNEIIHEEQINNEIMEDSNKRNPMETDTNEDITLNKVNMELMIKKTLI